MHGVTKVCYILVGPSGSGKSTVLQNLLGSLADKPKTVFSLDKCRLDFLFSKVGDTCQHDLWKPEHTMKWIHGVNENDVKLCCKVCTQFGVLSMVDVYGASFKNATANEKEFDAFVNESWREALKSEEYLIVDNTSITRKSRARWTTDARNKGFKIVGIEIMTPLQTIIDRQTSRPDKSVPVDTVRHMFFNQQSLLVGSEVDFLLHVDGTKEFIGYVVN